MKKAIVPRRSHYSGYRRSRSRSRSPHSKNYNSRRSGNRSGRSGGGGGRNDRSGGSRGGGGQDRKRKSSGDSSSSNSKTKKKPYNDKKGTFTPASLLDAVETGFFSKSSELLVSDSGLDISRILDLIQCQCNARSQFNNSTIDNIYLPINGQFTAKNGSKWSFP